MKEFKVKGKKRLCFLVAEGTENYIVISVESLADIDIRRLYAVEQKSEKSGVQMMRVMKNETLDNGMNCLLQYKDLLSVVPRTAKAEEIQKVAEKEVPLLITEKGFEDMEKKEPKKRGRKLGSKNKPKNSE